MALAKLKGTLSSLVWSRNPVTMHPSVFKALWSYSYWLQGITLWVSVPLSLKVVLSALPYLQLLYRYLVVICRVYLCLYCIPYCAVSPYGNAILSRLYA